MALPPSPPSTSIGTFNTQYTYRDDISELLLSSLALENTLAGLLPVGESFADPNACRWNEDTLNIYEYTDNTVAGQNATDTTSTFTLTSGQGSSLTVGALLYDTGETFDTGGVELVQVIGLVGDTATVQRAVDGTTETTHASGATWRNIGGMLAETSDLDKDVSHNRLPFYNIMSRIGLSVQISDEQLQRAMAGYVVGVSNELDYQLLQRVREVKRMWDNNLIMSRRSTAAGDYSSMQGVLGFLLTNSVDNAGAAWTPALVNTDYQSVFNQGGDPDWLLAGSTIVRKIANTYSDRIRIEQSDRSRGWSVIYFETDLAKPLRVVLDAYMPAQAYALLDSRRIQVKPFINSFFYWRTAQSFRDGEAARVISKASLEMRNALTVASGGAGQAHILRVRNS